MTTSKGEFCKLNLLGLNRSKGQVGKGRRGIVKLCVGDNDYKGTSTKDVRFGEQRTRRVLLSFASKTLSFNIVVLKWEIDFRGTFRKGSKDS